MAGHLHVECGRAPKTVKNVLTVLSVVLRTALEWGVIALSPNALARCTRSTVPFEAMPLGFSRFAFAYPSRNRKANSLNVGIF
ncbi:MAG TPA: hypothetical protein VMO26_02755 [Vicinamibacterales bacterium]|nr:hypothetical protein [Vicinamibacterales bacterium]